jgi:hypothetical protein
MMGVRLASRYRESQLSRAAAPDQPVDTVANCDNRKASASYRCGGSLTLPGASALFIRPGAFSQFPLPLQANAVGEPIVRTIVKAAADNKPEVSFMDLLPCGPPVEY